MKIIILLLILFSSALTIYSQNFDLDISTESVTISSFSQSEYENSSFISSDNPFSQGIEIIPEQESVTISLNGQSYIESEKSFDNIQPGSYYLEISKQGYKSFKKWIILEKNRRVVIEITLAREFGYLNIVSNGNDPEILINGKLVNKYSPLPTGTYELTIRSFGFIEESKSITVFTDETTNETFMLKEADFEIESLKVRKKVFNSKAKEGFGENVFIINVNAPGEGVLLIEDSNNNILFTDDITFNTWKNEFRFRQPLEDGSYLVKVKSNNIVKSSNFTVDSNINQGILPSFGINTGLLMCQTAEINTKGLSQYQFILGSGLASNDVYLSFNSNSSVSNSVQLKGGMEVEIDAKNESSSFNFNAGFLYIKELNTVSIGLSPMYNFNSLVQENIDNKYYNYLSLGIPATISISTVKLTLSPNLTYEVTEDFTYNLGAGLHYDNQKIRTGLSGEYMSEDFSNYDLTFGYELYYLLPESQSYLGLGLLIFEDLDAKLLINFTALF